MRIVLEMFDNMRSEVMHVPENSTARWKMALTQGIGYITRDGFTSETKPINTVCEFEYTGKKEIIDGCTTYIYRLIDINKE